MGLIGIVFSVLPVVSVLMIVNTYKGTTAF